MQFHHQQGQRTIFLQWCSLWSAPAWLALLLSQAMLGTAHGRSTASPTQSGSTAPALQKAVTCGQLAVHFLALLCFLASLPRG
jgi:hypothetical protein